MYSETHYQHESESRQAQRAASWVYAIWDLKSMILGAFGLASMTALAVLDFEFAWHFSLAPMILTSSCAFVAIGMWRFRSRLRKALAWLGAAWLILTVLVIGVLMSGVLTERHALLPELMLNPIRLAPLLERAHASGHSPTTPHELSAALNIAPLDWLDGRYYSTDSYRWSLRFDPDGRFVGTFIVTGDRKRNLPGAEVRILDRRRPVVAFGDYKSYVPIHFRE